MTNRIKNLYPKLYDFQNLYIAFKKAAKGRGNRKEIAKFAYELEPNLIAIQNDLIWLSYKPGRYREFYVYEPKKRLIMALPFRDRVIQWAIYRQLNPLLDKKYIVSSFACRIGGGAIRAAKLLQTYMRLQTGPIYVLKLDIAKYFYRINKKVLSDILAAVIKDKDLLDLLRIIIFSDDNFGIDVTDLNYTGARVADTGVPIGNLTSQMIANLYLHTLDIYAKHLLKARYYVRYMDDICIISTDPAALKIIWEKADVFLRECLKLQLNAKSRILKESNGIDFCGYRVHRDHITIRRSTSLKAKRKIKARDAQLNKGLITEEKFVNTLASYMGQMCHCDSWNLQRTIIQGLSEKAFNAYAATRGGAKVLERLGLLPDKDKK